MGVGTRMFTTMRTVGLPEVAMLRSRTLHIWGGGDFTRQARYALVATILLARLLVVEIQTG